VVGWAVLGSAAGLPVTPRYHSAFHTCILTAYPKATFVAADTWADENSPGQKKGGGGTMQVQSNSGRNQRAYIRFEMTKCVPTPSSAATVLKATLRLNLASAPPGSRTYHLHRVTGPCPEAATTCWTESGLTWNNKPAAAASPTAALDLSATSTPNQYYDFDVTADVAAMVTGTASNYGWRIADSAEGNPSAVIVTFKAKDLVSPSGAPQLVIAYSP
jgi:hypothetical protein